MTQIPANQLGYALPDASKKPTRIVGQGEDGVEKEMFLKLMLAQLKNQDPTAPMDQKDMMASITQFSQMEQMQNMATAMETLSLTQGTGMIGKEILYKVEIKNAAGQIIRETEVPGKVIAVRQGASGVVLELEPPEGSIEGTPGPTTKPSAVTKVFG